MSAPISENVENELEPITIDGAEQRSYAFEEAEIRSQGSGSRQRFTFRGYAAVFGQLSHELRALGGRTFRERVERGAFARTLQEDEIRLLINHEPRLLLGRTSSGTLRLGEDTRGLEVEDDLPNTSYARDYAELVERGDAGEMSFRFAPPAPRTESWAVENGSSIRSLRELKLREVSALTEPAAYPGTSAAIDAELRALAFGLDELRAGRQLSTASRAAITAAIDELNRLLAEADGGDGEAIVAAVPNVRRLRLELRERERELPAA